MKDLDLYKIIIYLSILAIPVAGYWAYHETQQLKVAKAAVKRATKGSRSDPSLLEKIGLLQKEIETIKSAARDNSSGDASIYFEKEISGATGLGQTDFSVRQDIKPGSGTRSWTDITADIKFERAGKPLPLSREQIYALLFNCEAKSEGVWKLRSFEMINEEAARSRGKSPPPKTVSDIWELKKMIFARREPAKNPKKKPKKRR